MLGGASQIRKVLSAYGVMKVFQYFEVPAMEDSPAMVRRALQYYLVRLLMRVFREGSSTVEMGK